MTLLNELYQLSLFEDATDDELLWLIERGRVESLESGEFFFVEGQRRDEFYVVLEGELQVTRVIDGTPTVMGTTPRGIIGGELNLLFAAPSPSTAQAIMPSRLFVLGAATFRAMFGTCPTVGAKVLRIAAQRTAGVATMVKQQEKMAALGKLSAGLAHELNNPAAAARRAAAELRMAMPALQTLTVQLCGLGLGETQFDALLALASAASARPHATLSPLEQSDREDELSTWLDDHGVADGWEVAPALASASIGLDDLDALALSLPETALSAVLAWLRQSLDAMSLLHTLEQSSERISALVGAVKSYTYMDQAPLQEIDVQAGLENTLTVLGHKLKGISVLREYDPDLPRIMARGGELNQVWTNIIDNAIDAMHGQGTIRLITRCENNFVMVEVTDDGPGIPAAVLPRIFEPFFTTKDIGVGSGMGLDISYRIIRQHDGTIEVQSEPGLTRFIIRLPVGS